MQKKRVHFGLNRHTTVVAELVGKKPATYKCAKAIRGTLGRERTDGEKKQLVALAHQNAKRCEMIKTAEGCMLLLGKMRHRDEHTYRQWEQTGLDAIKEDRKAKGLPPLQAEKTDVDDSDNAVPTAMMQTEPGPAQDGCP